MKKPDTGDKTLAARCPGNTPMVIRRFAERESGLQRWPMTVAWAPGE